MKRGPVELRCSFCGKSKEEVRRLVAGPGVFICDDCVALCNEIISAAPPPTGPAEGKPPRWVRVTGSRQGWWRRLFHIEAGAPVYL